MGFRFATSVYGTLTGEGGDIIIADDPINALQANSQNFRNKVKEWFFKQSPLLDCVYTTNKNFEEFATYIDIDLENHFLLAHACKERKIDAGAAFIAKVREKIFESCNLNEDSKNILKDIDFSNQYIVKLLGFLSSKAECL